jgi:hypothetical protein
LNLTDKCYTKGALRIRVLDARDRRVLRTINTPNQVCIGALDALQRTFTQLTPADNDADECKLFSIWAGDGTTTPTAADLTLASEQFRKEFDAGTLVKNVGSVVGLIQAQMTMDKLEGGTYTYSEAGLFTQGPVATPIASQTPGIGAGNARMVARQVHAQIQKSSSIAIEYTWRFQILTV